MFSIDVYKERRDKLKKAVGHGLILFLGNEEVGMNYRDNTYHFRQDSSFLYFFGLDKPGLAALINIDEDIEIIIGNEPTIDDIVWMGTQPSLTEIAAQTGINKVAESNSLGILIKKSLSSGQAVHYLPPYRSDAVIKLSDILEIPNTKVKEGASVILIKAVIAQRAYKSALEVTEIDKAVNISNEMHLAAIRYSKENVTEKYVAGIVEGLALSAGGTIAYPVIYTVNGQTLHNHPTNDTLKKGQLILCDCGAETAMHYAGDLTRTFPVDQKFTSLQKEVYEIVLKAEQAAANSLRPGIRFLDIHKLACEHLVDGLKQLGLMKGDVKDAVSEGAHTLFFQCGLGHMMGLDVHDMEDLGEQFVGYSEGMVKSKEFGLKSLRLGRELEAGFVLTVEPGLYFIPELMDMWQAQGKLKDFINYDKLAAFRNFGGARVEENFLITESGYQLLGEPLIKAVSDIEGLNRL
ncbi:aminopeptidase P family protein [Dyadobacter frigoris]|uniref:Xaa-Pro aminopeptidase n=1 Tax=Dyadobacter frigoris TaxID=2576211 RepID=A0A4U6CUZ9_9BACT|nr:aminopeptidase P family protein [Dyadobacter frigoris]TKT86898.1 M24 family metallopeptidase [Dyadobacter frigoris]GLU56602.1 Xaa-Pro aminopeptidase [Dyadobacter frigoris]